MGKSHTKDEKFMITLYELTQESKDERPTFDRYAVGAKCSIMPKAVDAICKLLLQANFLKKAEERTVYITPHGESLARRLIEED